MYIIINKTTKTTTNHRGNWPDLDKELDNGDDIIVISLYSDTIKVPKKVNDEWEWLDFPGTEAFRTIYYFMTY